MLHYSFNTIAVILFFRFKQFKISENKNVRYFLQCVKPRKIPNHSEVVMKAQEYE